MTAPKYSPGTLRWLEARTRENIIFNHLVELIQTRDTQRRPDAPDGVIRYLKQAGFMTVTPPHKWDNGRRWTYRLTEKCLRIVEDMENCQDMTQKMPARALENAQSGRTVPIQASSIEEGKRNE